MASLRIATFGGLLMMVSALPAAAQTTPPPIEQVLDTVTAGETFRGVALSPDGARVAWVEAVRDKDGRPTSRSAVFISDLAGSSSHQITARAANATEIAESDPAWAPDGRRLAFISDAVGGEEQIFIADASQPEPKPRQVTQLHGHLSTPSFSPDGRAIAFLYLEGRKGPAGPLQATARDAGVVGEHPDEQRLAVVDLASGEVRILSPADLYVYEYDWAPDGRSFAATAAHGSGDDNWYVAELYTLNRESGEMRSIWKPPVDVQIAVPRVSPTAVPSL